MKREKLMKKLGIGVDIIDNSRIKRSIINKRFLFKVFSKAEIINSKKTSNKTGYFSKRFAAKEAFSKALGTGFSNGIYWKDIGVINDKYGKPKIKLTGKSLKKFKKLIPKNKKHSINLTLSDENHIAHALVIISSH